MSVMLQQLENNEAILLMYIAGELPEDERREVEGMLKTDGRLRQMHEELRSAWAETMSGVDGLDASEPMAFSREAAARKVGRMVRQWHAERTAPRPGPVPAQRYRWPWWAIASSAVAASVVGFLVWWGQYNEVGGIAQNTASTQQGVEGSAGSGSGSGDGQGGPSTAQSQPPQPVPGFGGFGPLSAEDWDKRAYVDPGRTPVLEIRDLEKQVAAIERLAGEEAVP